MDQDDLLPIFQEYGYVQELIVIREKGTQHHKGKERESTPPPPF